MSGHCGIEDPREWLVAWLTDRFGTTRECLEQPGQKLSDVTMFDDTDRLFLEYDVEADFSIAVPDGSFDGLDTMDAIVARMNELIGKPEKETPRPVI